MPRSIINTREDLDSIVDPTEYSDFIQMLSSSMTKRVNIASYPDEYDYSLLPDDTNYVQPNWQYVEDLSIIKRFNFTKEEIESLVSSLIKEY